MVEALCYSRKDQNRVLCFLCSQRCLIEDGQRGKCGVRENKSGMLETLVYGRLVARNVDPIEKKPLFHLYPGSLSYSIATVGCNFKCRFCQNADISQMPRERGQIQGRQATPEEVVPIATQRVVEQKLLAAEARRFGLEPGPARVQQLLAAAERQAGGRQRLADNLAGGGSSLAQLEEHRVGVAHDRAPQFPRPDRGIDPEAVVAPVHPDAVVDGEQRRVERPCIRRQLTPRHVDSRREGAPAGTHLQSLALDRLGDDRR